jgi:hypothetical protein
MAAGPSNTPEPHRDPAVVGDESMRAYAQTRYSDALTRHSSDLQAAQLEFDSIHGTYEQLIAFMDQQTSGVQLTSEQFATARSFKQMLENMQVAALGRLEPLRTGTPLEVQRSETALRDVSALLDQNRNERRAKKAGH